jgi:hypothetical protein
MLAINWATGFPERRGDGTPLILDILSVKQMGDEQSLLARSLKIVLHLWDYCIR